MVRYLERLDVDHECDR